MIELRLRYSPRTDQHHAGKTRLHATAYDASAVALLVYAGGFVASFWLPEPQQDKLPD